MAKSSGMKNAPSTTGKPSGSGRSNNAPITSRGSGNESSGSKSSGKK